jgi:hypothetical protein
LLDSQYRGRASATKASDLILLVVVLVLLGLLWGSGQGDYVSFAVGLWAGMTLIQTYFHEFSQPLLPEEMPTEAPGSPIKMMSYAIQATQQGRGSIW